MEGGQVGSAVVLMEETSGAAPPLRAHFLIGNKGISMPVSQSDEHQKSGEHIRIFHLHHRCLAQPGPQYALKKYISVEIMKESNQVIYVEKALWA